MSRRSSSCIRVGRPRASPDTAEGPAREAILAAARELFREQGFSATTTRQIAARVGLRQPSLFHHFSTKQAILRELALGAVRPVVEFIDAERSRPLPADVALYRLVRFDVHHLCTSDDALGSPFLFPEISRERLPEFWKMRDRISNRYRELLRQGVREGVFAVQDASLVAELLFGLVESVLLHEQSARRRKARKLAQVTAGLALRSVLKDPRGLRDLPDRAAAAAPEPPANVQEG